MAFVAKYPHAKFIGPLAENLLALVEANMPDALAQIAAEDGTTALPTFELVINNPWGRNSQVFPVFWIDDEDTPLQEGEDAASLEETHKLTFWLGIKRVLDGTPTPKAQNEASSQLRKDARVYARAVVQIFLSANPRVDFTAGMEPFQQTIPVITSIRQRVFGPTGGNNELIAYGMVEITATMQEG